MLTKAKMLILWNIITIKKNIYSFESEVQFPAAITPAVFIVTRSF